MTQPRTNNMSTLIVFPDGGYHRSVSLHGTYQAGNDMQLGDKNPSQKKRNLCSYYIKNCRYMGLTTSHIL